MPDAGDDTEYNQEPLSPLTPVNLSLLTQDSESTRLSVLTSDLSGDYYALPQSVTNVFQQDIKMK